MIKATSAVIAAIALCVGNGAFAPAASAIDAIPRPIHYVALGDSYSAGLGANQNNIYDEPCTRSALSYTTRWATENNVDSFTDATCSGARTADVTSNRQSHTPGPQVGALTPETNVVTVTIGGNDVGFALGLATCVISEYDNVKSPLCVSAIKRSREIVASAALSQRLTDLYQTVRSRISRDGTVYVLGYPELFTVKNTLAISGSSRQQINELVVSLNEVIRRAALSAGAVYLDVAELMRGHGIGSADPWINDLNLSALRQTAHPTAVGYEKGYLAALRAATR